MSCDLERVYGALALAVPDDDEDDAATYDARVLPSPHEDLATDRIVAKLGRSMYGSVVRDRVDLHASRPTFRQLGLWLLSTMFHAGPKTATLRLLHPDSSIVRLDAGGTSGAADPWLVETPSSFRYYHDDESGRWAIHSGGGRRSRHDLVNLRVLGPSQFDDFADELHVRMPPRNWGCAALADLFLRIGNPRCKVEDVSLDECNDPPTISTAGALLNILTPESFGWEGPEIDSALP